MRVADKHKGTSNTVLIRWWPFSLVSDVYKLLASVSLCRRGLVAISVDGDEVQAG